MNFYVFREEDKLGTAYNRCFLDAENGRVWLALQRLEDLREHFLNDAEIDLAEAMLRIQFLGQGFRGQELCWRAYQRKPSLVDALKNALKFSPDAVTFQERAALALRSLPGDPVLKMLMQTEKTIREEGELYWVFQKELLAQVPHDRDAGTFAAIIELMLISGGEEIPPDQRANFLRYRGEALRRLDRTAQDKLTFFSEAHIPKERLILQQALLEFESKIDDPYFRNAEILNLCASWSYLLHRFQDAINYADAAIEMGGPEYINPLRNKALAMSAMGNKEKAFLVFNDALEKAVGQGDQAQVQVIGGTLEEQKKAPPLGLAELCPKLEAVLSAVGSAAYSEITANKGTLESVGGSFLERLHKIGFDWTPAYVLVLAELLVYHSPEAAHFIIQKAVSDLPKHYGNHVNGNLGIAAHYLAAYASGALRRDAVRLRTIQLICTRDVDLILDAYRRQVRDISAEADPPLSEVADLIKSEMARIHPLIPNFLDDQPPISVEDRKRARSVIHEVFLVRFKQTNGIGAKAEIDDQVNMTNIQKQQPASRKSWLRKLLGR
jgi:tetratricopeptide (TPR) repeat protein